MLRAAWKGLIGHRLRLVLTALAIVLGTGLVAGSYIFTDTLTQVFDDLFADSFSGIDVQVAATQDSDLGFAVPERLPEELVAEIEQVEGVAEAVGTVGGLFTLVGPDGEPVGGQGPPTIGGSWSDVASPLGIREGRPPRQDGELAVDVATARRAGIEVGEEVQVITLGRAQPHQVVGLVSFAGSDSFGGATFVAFSFDTAQRLFAAEGQVDTISVVADPGVAPSTLIERIEPLLPPDTEAVDAQTAAEEQLAGFKEALGFLNTFLLVFGFVALFVGAFLIQNTFQIVVAQRTRELGLLRAVGASRRQVTGMVLGEALGVSVVASLAGVGLGLVLALGIQLGFESLGGDLPAAPLQLRPRTVAITLAAGVAVTLASAWLPARRAGQVPPVAALREGLTPPSARSLRLRALTGVVVTVSGLALVAAGLFGQLSLPLADVGVVGVGAGVAFIGLALVAPAIARPLGRGLGAPLTPLFGTVGRMAKENAVRSPRRTAATASALMIGVALASLVTIMAASIRATTDALVDDRFRADLVVQPVGFGGAGLSPALAGELEGLDEVETVVRTRRGPVKIGEEVGFLAAAELDRIEKAIRLDVVAGSLQAVGSRGLAVSTEEADERGWDLGEQVELTFARTGTVPFTVEAIYTSEGPGADVYVDLTTWEEHYVERYDSSVFLAFADGVPSAAGREAVERVVDRYPGSTVLDQTEFRDEAVAQLDSFVLLIFALLALALVIGFVGIVNTLLLSVVERTREIGLLRAVGTSRRQIRQMVTWESVIIALFGAVMGTVVGIGFGWAVVAALSADTEILFRVPAGQLAVMVGASALAGIAAALYPARRAARLDVLRAIAYE